MSKKVKLQKYPPLLAIVGPTASGKTDLSLLLAKKYHGCIISADSRQIYQQAKIGTCQPNGSWRVANSRWQKILNAKKIYLVQGIPHFFIDELAPNKTYSVVKFQKKANQLIRKLSAVGYLPILVGGTGLYVSAITQGYQFSSAKPNKLLRNKLNKSTLKNLLNRLKKIDPATYKVIDKNNSRRIIRALEYVLTTGQSFINSQISEIRPNTLILGLKTNDLKLLINIKKRTKLLLKLDLIKETEQLLKKYPNSVLLKTIGYRETINLVKKEVDLKEATNLIALHTRQYAKRQLTWLKKMPNINWINNVQQAEKNINKFIS
ncbi:MAG: tRNA (adenosine(37)-N6)-dimethylallyltransferase MiaA [Patescibacteria group bacterium]